MSKFVGEYVGNLKGAIKVSLVSREHMVFIGGPGSGKTAMMYAALQHGFGKDKYCFLPIEPSTPPEAIDGAYDPAAVLNGKLVRVVKGTPSDPEMQRALLDEFFRGNELVFDSCIHLFDNKMRPGLDKMLIWATSNFVPKADRQAALLDRVAIWVHVKTGKIDIQGILNSHMLEDDGSFEDGLPTWEQCVEIHKAAPTQKTLKVVGAHLKLIEKEAHSIGLEINPRRIVQWGNILYRVSVFVLGKSDFDEIPNDAIRALMFCYPTADANKSVQFAQLVYATCNAENAAFMEYRKSLLQQINDVIVSSKSIVEKCSTVNTIFENARKDVEKFMQEKEAHRFIDSHVEWAVGILSGNTSADTKPPVVEAEVKAGGLFS